MNWWIIGLTFIGINLDFFVILLLLLQRFRLLPVISGYCLGLIVLLGLSFGLGKILQTFLPEWLLGVLGIFPIYLAFHDDDDVTQNKTSTHPIKTTFLTYLSVCSGCNLSLFLPILTNLNSKQFIEATLFILLLSIILTVMIKIIGDLKTIQKFIHKYSEPLTKIIYVAVGCYVFWDSGLITHLIQLF